MCKHRLQLRCKRCSRDIPSKHKLVEYVEVVKNSISCKQQGCTKEKPLNRTKHYDQFPPMYLDTAPANCRFCKNKSPQPDPATPVQQPKAQPKHTAARPQRTESSFSVPPVEKPCLVCQNARRDCDYRKPECRPCSEDWKI